MLQQMTWSQQDICIDVDHRVKKSSMKCETFMGISSRPQEKKKIILPPQ